MKPKNEINKYHLGVNMQFSKIYNGLIQNVKVKIQSIGVVNKQYKNY